MRCLQTAVSVFSSRDACTVGGCCPHVVLRHGKNRSLSLPRFRLVIILFFFLHDFLLLVFGTALSVCFLVLDSLDYFYFAVAVHTRVKCCLATLL